MDDGRDAARFGAVRSVPRAQWHVTRRSLLKGAGGVGAGVVLGRAMLPRLVRAQASTSDSALAQVPLPPDRGQSAFQVFVPERGHTIRGTMLDYWRANGAAAVYGNPISEPFASTDGYYSQAFERAIFQYRPEFIDTNDPYIRLMAIGQAVIRARHGGESIDGRRVGGDPKTTPWVALAADNPHVAKIVGDGGSFVADSGHTISGALLDWYNAHEGGFYLGNPLSEPLTEGGEQVQYFDGGVLRKHHDGTVALRPVVSQLASSLGIDTTPVPQGTLPAYSEDLFAGLGVQPSDDDLANAGQADDPWPQIIGDVMGTPGRRWVEVNLNEPEQLWAWQGQTQVMTSMVSTGLAPNLTAPGLFHVRWRFNSESMQGFVGATGEVTGFGTTPPPGGGSAWSVPDVPNVMYFNTAAEALHGCYWHNNFGYPMSHGCVNLPLQVAAWMYGWAPLGTMVWIHA